MQSIEDIVLYEIKRSLEIYRRDTIMVTMDSVLDEIGIDSLDKMEILMEVEHETKRLMDGAKIKEAETVKELVDAIKAEME